MNGSRFLFLLVAFFAVAGCQRNTPAQDHFQKGYDAYVHNDFETARLYMQPLVEDNHPAAMLLMARMYERGEGVEQDIGKADYLRAMATAQLNRKHLYQDLPKAAGDGGNNFKLLNERMEYYIGTKNAGETLRAFSPASPDGASAGELTPAEDAAILSVSNIRVVTQREKTRLLAMETSGGLCALIGGIGLWFSVPRRSARKKASKTR